MARQLLKPYSLLFYFLTSFTFFFVGVTYAGVTEAAKGQGLAGGAIVLGYGVITAFFAFLVALFIASKVSRKMVINLNKFLALAIIAFSSYYTWNYFTNVKPKRDQNKIEKQKHSTKTTKPIAMLYINSKKAATQTKLTGLGMFAPNAHEKSVLYFYGTINYEKALNEHMPTDSITFKKDQYNNIIIATAPPWLAPEHLKLDYGILYFRIKTVGREFVEVEGNKMNNHSAYVSADSGKILYWPEFFLNVNSVEFHEPKTQSVYSRPFYHAGVVNIDYSFMKPLKVKNQWMYVELLTDNFKKVGKGWIQWRKEGKLLINYSLLS